MIAWNHRRFLTACAVSGVRSTSDLVKLVNDARPPGAPRIPAKTARAYIDGSHNPMISSGGKIAGVFELAAALDVSVDWLTTVPEIAGPS